MWASNRTAAAALDSTDALADLPARYQLPPGVIRLDGSGGGTWTGTESNRLRRFVQHRWEKNHARPRAGGERRGEVHAVTNALAPLLGARPHELTVAESSPVNLFNTLLATTRLRPERPVIVVGHDCFAADSYLARSAADFSGCELRLMRREESLSDVLDERVAVVALSHTDVTTGAVRDPVAINSEVHRHGALTLLDLTDSAGALNVDLRGWDADFAIGSGDKYLGGGPGAPAYSFIAQEHHEDLAAAFGAQSCCDRRSGVLNPLNTGFGGTPSMLSISDLRAGLSILEGVSSAELERKAGQLVEVFRQRLDSQGVTGDGRLELITPSAGNPRGSQVLLRHRDAQRVAQRLLRRGVVVNFVEPDTLRFNFAPSWLRYVDAWEAAELLHEVLDELEHAGTELDPLSSPPG